MKTYWMPFRASQSGWQYKGMKYFPRRNDLLIIFRRYVFQGCIRNKKILMRTP